MLSPEQLENIKAQIKTQIKNANLPGEQTTEFLEWLEHADAEEVEEFLRKQGQQSEGQAEGGECLFCGIGKGTIDTIKIYENAFVVAFLDITPAIPGQVMIIPKEHYQFIFQVPDMVLWEMTKAMKLIMPILVNITKAQGVSIYIAQGPGAGQRIGHIAINLVPRTEGDKAAFMWDRKEFPREELDKVAKEIKLGIDKSISEEKAKLEQKVRQETKLLSGQAMPAASAASAVPVPSAPAKEQLPEYPRRRP